MQEGCKYKHEIPPDDETRLAIGVRTYPTWPREDPVTAPRPPPLKAWQVPPVSKPDIKQSWRRHEAKGAAQVELPGPQRSPQHVTPPQASGPVPMFTHPLPGSFSPAVTSGSRQPTNAQSGPVQHISPANAAQHFPSYVNHAKQQSSHAQAGMPEFTRGHGQFQTQPTTTAGSYNNQPTNLTPQLQSMSLTNNIQNRPVAILQPPSRPSPRGNKQAPAPPPGKGNPFTQRVSSGTPSQPQNNAHASATPANSFKSGASKSSHAPGPSTAAVQTTVPPPYMPIFMKARPKTAEALTGTISSQPSGEAFEQHSSTSDTGSNSTSGSAAHGQGTASPTHNGSNNAASSTSHVNTPGSSNNTIHGASNVNSVIEQREHASVASGTRTATHATGNRNPSGNSFGNSRFSFSGLDPAIIATARTHAPVSVKGRGPILFNPYAQDESNGKAATSEHGSIANSFADVRSPTFSPPPIHRRMFRAPGEEEFVANPLEDAHTKSDRTTKKHVGSNGSAKGRKTSHPSKHHGRPQNQSNNGDYLG